ncbi:MAG: segregation/condensation protein A [candidate division WOR-3 bacterium]|nr:segregation/condensation protein A [candidate division WOR-3 bacterium]
MSSVRFELELDFFSGPLDLLLYLIQREEIPLERIPIALITEKYLDFIIPYLQKPDLKSEEINKLSEYLLLAIILIRYKIRAFLKLKTQEEIEIKPEEEISFYKIKEEFNYYKKIASLLKELEEEKLKFFPREGDIVKEEREELPTIYELLKSYQKVWISLNNIPTEITWLEKRKINIDEKMEEIREKVRKIRFLEFSQLINDFSCKEEIVVTFFLLLELVRLGEIRLIQEEIFGNLIIIALK